MAQAKLPRLRVNTLKSIQSGCQKWLGWWVDGKATIQVNFVPSPSETDNTNSPELSLLKHFCYQPTITAIFGCPL